ncbi:hypothetical protein chiPu_0013774 [Chiloscyllium punctatum]|uniref:cGMP-dependent protein kinase N-terminal coiled-coil domain-containing protein n=1 Tax=Chiloscyllium punctatum TaxID=137246 RepID=A0A401SY23_CHIPU|nr:hypothetical protein [Chiloscyllium punctatum]
MLDVDMPVREKLYVINQENPITVLGKVGAGDDLNHNLTVCGEMHWEAVLDPRARFEEALTGRVNGTTRQLLLIHISQSGSWLRIEDFAVCARLIENRLKMSETARAFNALLALKEAKIQELELQLVKREQEIQDLRVKLHKCQSVLPKTQLLPRTRRAPGISAEPPCCSSSFDWHNFKLQAHEKPAR